MHINTLTPEKLRNELYSIPVSQTVEKLSSSQEASKSSAGWRRLRSETTPSIRISTEEEFQEQLQIQLEEAIDTEQYEKALGILDQIKNIPDEYSHDIPGYSEIGKLNIKSYCLKKLGRLEEAYFFATEALSKVPSLGEKAKEAFLSFLRENSAIPSEGDVSFLDLFISKIIDQQVAELHRDLLLERGFLSLALNQKELAIDDFRAAASCACDDQDKCYDPEFLFRVLEKALGTQIAPTKDYEKEIATLLQEDYLHEEERYQLVMYYALLGQHDKAVEWYERIEAIDNFPSEVLFFLAYLKGDMETAREELEHCPDEDYKLILTPPILQEQNGRQLMDIRAIQNKASTSSTFNTQLPPTHATGLPEIKVHPKASLRKFMGESAVSLFKMREQREAEKPLDFHYDKVIKDLQMLVNIEECKRALKDLNRELENFDRDLSDPKLSDFERELKIFQKPFLYERRSALNFLLGNLEESLTDEWTFQSLNFEFYNQNDFLFLKFPCSTYQNALNDWNKNSIVVAGLGSLLFNQEKNGMDQLNLAASAGSAQAVLLLLALGKTLPAPLNCNPVQPQPKKEIDEGVFAGYDELARQQEREFIEKQNQKLANEDFFAHLQELFQRQQYSQVVEEADQFLKDANLESWEGRFFFHIRGASKAALNDLTGAIADYNQVGDHHEWVIERALVKILAGDWAGAKTELQRMPATRGYTHEQPVSADEFVIYDFEPWKIRALMVEKLFDPAGEVFEKIGSEK